MALGKRLINTGGVAACSTDSVQAFGANDAFSSNIALYQLDGNDDDTTTNYDGTSDTGVTYSATGAKFGQAASFNGSSSKIELPNLGTNVSGSSPRTVSLWVNLDHYPTAGEVLSTAFYMGTAAALSSWAISITTGGEVRVSGYNNDWITTETISTGTWTNIVCLYRGGAHETAANSDIYIDGILANKTLIAGTGSNAGPLNTTNSNYSIGYFKSVNSYYFDGSIDQVRIFDKAISEEDVATLYAETSSTASNTNPFSEGSGVALYTMDYDASEASGYYDGTPTNVEFGVGGKINYGARFNGSSSYIDVSSFSFGSDNLSISLWIKPSSTQNAYANIIDFNQTYISKAGVFAIQQDASNTNQYQVWQSNGSSYNISNSVTLTADTWNHLVYTLQSNGNYALYLNGTSSTTGSNLTASTSGVTETLNIGRWYNNGGSAGRYFNGDIDQVRIFSKALNQTEISTLYAEIACVYDSTTNDVNYPFDNATNVEAYYKLDNSSEDYVGGNDGTDTNIEYRFGRYGQAAVFDGSSSFIDTNYKLTGDTSVSF